MATVKIILDKGETREDAEEMLLKALKHHASGAEHKEDFTQAAAREVLNKMTKSHEHVWSGMLKEINEIIDSDVKQ